VIARKASAYEKGGQF
jgi:stress-induced-phosphoprotein 1